jgi:hypothetical protein
MLIADLMLETAEQLQALISKLKREPKPTPSLLAYNIDWFTNCTWLEQLISFKQIDTYYTYKH